MPVVGENTTAIKWVALRMPNARGWPARFGGVWMRTRPGVNSQSLLSQLRDDCPTCPAWPDPYNSSLAAAADAVAGEKLALMPMWLGHGFMTRGRRGLWEPQMLGGAPRRQVMGHIWSVPYGMYGKKAVQMALGEFDFEVADRARSGLAGQNHSAYLACHNYQPWYKEVPGPDAAAGDGGTVEAGGVTGGKLAGGADGVGAGRREAGGAGEEGSPGDGDLCGLRLLAFHPTVSRGMSRCGGTSKCRRNLGVLRGRCGVHIIAV